MRGLLAAGVVLAAALPLPSLAQPAARAASAAPAASAPAADLVRAAMVAPLEAARALISQGKTQEALAKLAEADALGALSPYETMIVQRNRAVAAQAAGDPVLMMSSLEAALATGKVEPADELMLIESLVGNAGRNRDHARVLRWSQRYIDLKGPNDAVRQVRIASLIGSGDERGGLAALTERSAADEAAGRVVTEPTLRSMLYLQRRLNDAASGKTLEQLALRFPRPEYWLDLIAPATRRLADNDRAVAELYRLLRAVGALNSAEMHEALAQMAIRAGQPVEAQTIVDEGFAAGLLGSGAKAADHQKLRDQARKQAAADIADRAAAETAARRAADGSAMVDLGWSIITGQPRSGAAPELSERGLALIEQGLAKGGVKRPAEARLHLGVAQLAAGRKDAAKATLAALVSASAGASAGMSTNDPLAEPIRLWALWAGAAAPLPPYKP